MIDRPPSSPSTPGTLVSAGVPTGAASRRSCLLACVLSCVLTRGRRTAQSTGRTVPRGVGILLLVGLTACGAPNTNDSPAASPPSSGPAFPTNESPSRALAINSASFSIRSITLDARDRPPDTTLAAIARLGATDLTLIPFGFQRSVDEPRIRMHTDGGWYSESTTGIRDLARRAEVLGMGIILKPHIWIGRYSANGQSRDAIGFDTEAAWTTWEAEYRTFLLYYAELAADIDARALVIGSELRRAAAERPAFWRGLATDIRKVYDGKLAYAANWSDSFDVITFWDALDYVGVQAYFPLTDGPRRHADTLTVEDLVGGWNRHVDMLRRVHEDSGRPVLFTELGYRSAPDAAHAPWRWPEENADEPPALDLQARLYRAFFQRFATVPWLAGAIVWKWHPEAEARRPTGFTPQGKPAETVLRQGFGGA